MKFLFWANCFVWAAVGGYVIFLFLKLKRVAEKIDECDKIMAAKKSRRDD